MFRRTVRRLGRTGLPLLVLALAGGPVAARAATYTVSFDDNAESSSQAIERERVLAVSPSIRTERLKAGPNGLTVYENVLTDFIPNWSTPGSGRAWARATADDLVITGPAGSGPVTGTFYFQVHANPHLEGGYAGNNAHGAYFIFRAECPGRALAQGDLFTGNASSSGSGVFAGYAGGALSAVVPMTGSFPVNQPFSVVVRIEARCYTYGNASVGPGTATMAAGGDGPGPLGVMFGDPTGLAMDLPAGFALASADLGIVDSRAPSLAAVGDEPAGAAGLLAAAPNPTTAGAVFRFALARRAPAELRIYDLRGRLVRRLDIGALDAGPHVVDWDGRDADGSAVASGVYFTIVEARGESVRGKVVVVR